MKLAICGPGRCGKDTVAEWLGRNTRMRYKAGTSLWAAPLVFERMLAAGYDYTTVVDCWSDRHNHRQLWAETIGDINRDDPVKLYRDCLAEQDLLTGLRWRHELQAVRAAGLVDFWVWIERPGRYDPTQEYGPEECDVMIYNGGTLDDLDAKLRAFCRLAGIKVS